MTSDINLNDEKDNKTNTAGLNYFHRTGRCGNSLNEKKKDFFC